MGQNDIIEWLREQHKNNKTKWFTIPEIKEGLIKKGFSGIAVRRTSHHLFVLNTYDLIQTKGKGFWDHYKLFRYKED